MQIEQQLTDIVRQAMINIGLSEADKPMITVGKNPKFGDYQANGAMAIGKRLGQPPREIAAKILAALPDSPMIESADVAGPGFINLVLSKSWLAAEINLILSDDALGVAKTNQPDTVVVDYSAPNLAKEMHVGHLRSTVIGDAVVKVLEHLGHKVIRQNHMGDWGTQFGMLLEQLAEQSSGNDDVALSDLEAFYRASKQRFDEDEAFAQRSRENVVKLQAGDENMLKLWRRFIDISIDHSEEIYRRLGVSLQRQDVFAESAYNDDLQGVLEQLNAQGLLKDNDGAKVVYLPDLKDREGQPLGMIVQKSGGGFLYATTDLAAAQYRSKTLKANRLLYFIDARQSLHMQQVFTLSKMAGFVTEDCEMQHMSFGTMKGDDGKPFKSRSGDLIKLVDLLNEAEQRAAQLIESKSMGLPEEEKALLAQRIGMGSVKYADLSKNRTNDYVFNWDTMLSLDGNTAPYLMYAYARIQRLKENALEQGLKPEADIQLDNDYEKQLAIQLLQFETTLLNVGKEGFPHLLCHYLYTLAGLYMRFYEHCPTLKDNVEPAQKVSRLGLSEATALIIKQGLDLLGISVVSRM